MCTIGIRIRIALLKNIKIDDISMCKLLVFLNKPFPLVRDYQIMLNIIYKIIYFIYNFLISTYI